MSQEAKSHIILNVQACLQSTTEDPNGFMGAFMSVVESTETVLYSRPLVLTEEPIPLDTGWLGENAGLIGIINPKPIYPVNPTPEQVLEDKKKVIVVSFENYEDDENWIVPPGMPFFALPSNHKLVTLRTLYGEVRTKLYVFPR